MRVRPFVALAALVAACGDNGGAPDSGNDAGNDVADEQQPDVYTGPVGLMLVGTIVTPDTVIDGEVLVIGQTIVCADVASAACRGHARRSSGASIGMTTLCPSPGRISWSHPGQR